MVPGEAKNLNLFLLEAQYAGLFTIAEPVAQLEHIIKNICVALIYPYLNQIISNVMVQAGLPVVILPPISSVGFNFATINYEEPWFKRQYLKAVQLGNTEEVERLLRINQGLLNVLNEDGFTPVMVAIHNNREKTLQLLLSQGALLNVGNTSHQSIEVFAKACGNEIAAQLVQQAKIKCIDANSQLTQPLAWGERNLVKNCGAAMLDYWLAWQLQAQEYSQAYQLIARQVPTLTFKSMVPTIYKFQNPPNESMSFILKPTAPDRDCFFHAVGISGFNRDALVKKLLNNATPAIIAIFANEIRQFIYLGYADRHQDEQENNACQLLKLPNVEFIYLYTKPISMQWGKNKLKDLCLNDMKIDPNINQLFLFFNKKMNKLKLFFLDDDGEQEILRFLPKGNFILPVSKTNEIVIKINKNKLDSILKIR